MVLVVVELLEIALVAAVAALLLAGRGAVAGGRGVAVAGSGRIAAGGTGWLHALCENVKFFCHRCYELWIES